MKSPVVRADSRPRAVVIGLDSLQGLQAARILAGHRVPVIGVVRYPDDFRCRTNACEQVLVTDTKGPELIRTLEALGPQLQQKAVLFPCTDMSVLLVSNHRDKLAAWFHIVLPDAPVVEMLMDKPHFYTYAQEKGLPIPATCLLHQRADVQRAIETLTFPCILKPAKKTTLWEQHVKAKVVPVADADELLARYDYCSQWTGTMVVQELVEGGDDTLFSCNCYFDTLGRPVATFVSRKLRQWPPETGSGCFREECRNDAVLEATLQLFTSVGYRGLGYVEVKRDSRTGKHFIIEPNIGRPTGGSAIAEAGGVELLYAMYCDALGLPLPTQLEQHYRGVKWVYLLEDAQSALSYFRCGELTLPEWWRSWRGRRAYALLSWRDPQPMLGMFTMILRAVAGNIAKAVRVGRTHPAIADVDDVETATS